jgi:hypothetical protein
VLPLINIPVIPSNSPQELLVMGFPPIKEPTPINPTQSFVPPSEAFCLPLLPLLNVC